MPRFHAETAMLPEGWAADVAIDVDARGSITAVTRDAPLAGCERLAGAVIPGIPNLHSHAFQRAMAGLTEIAGPGDDSFWTWRDIMYRFLDRLGPRDIEAIAAQLYVELVKQGYTAVAEFHYLHNDRGGGAYEERTILADAICAAAGASGIGLTLLPVLYQAGGFGGQAPRPGQARFVLGTDAYLRLVETLLRRHRGDAQIRIGIAPHSLRAVAPVALAESCTAITRLDDKAPIHIHIAEQLREVEDCRAWSGQRPVEWLLAHAAVDRRWCAVHATHMTAEETLGLAQSGAVAGLCPTTEANLGDGVFDLARFTQARGALAVSLRSALGTAPHGRDASVLLARSALPAPRL